jgi:glutamyl-tRNA synthetase
VVGVEGREGGRAVVGRLAPSPTGGLHVGHARTFLVAWLAARAAGGRVVLRIEDLDSARVRPGVAELAEADLDWLGLDWDDGPVRQSGRMPLYGEALRRLIAGEHVYPCTCTRAEIARMQSAPHAEDEGPAYPGICAGRTADDAARLQREGRPFAWRFRASAGPVAWDDLVLGPTGRTVGGDFVVGRSSGEPAYQLAAVVDDALMEVTQVVRGDDLVPSTPRQLDLFRRTGWTRPDYGHVPLVQDAEGRRLAKRDGAIKLATLREGGADPRRLVGLLARSCGWSGRIESSRPGDWLGRFDLDRIPREPWRLTADDLHSLRP